MDTTNLTPRRALACDLRRAALIAGAAVLALTSLGLAAAAVWPGLAPSTPPHPALTGNLDDALGILANNLRALAAPFVLWLLGFPASRFGRLAGDCLVLSGIAVNTLTVGIELGRWRGELLPYVPQLPLEWTALSLAGATWLTVRTNHVNRVQITRLAGAIAVLLIAAAGVETWCTPRLQTRPTLIAGQVNTPVQPTAPMGAGGCLRSGFCADPGQSASRSPAALFPSQRSVPLGRFVGTDRALVNHRPPQGGINRWTST